MEREWGRGLAFYEGRIGKLGKLYQYGNRQLL